MSTRSTITLHNISIIIVTALDVVKQKLQSRQNCFYNQFILTFQDQGKKYYVQFFNIK